MLNSKGRTDLPLFVCRGMEISVGQNDSDPEDVMTFTKGVWADLVPIVLSVPI